VAESGPPQRSCALVRSNPLDYGGLRGECWSPVPLPPPSREKCADNWRRFHSRCSLTLASALAHSRVIPTETTKRHGANGCWQSDKNATDKVRISHQAKDCERSGADDHSRPPLGRR